MKTTVTDFRPSDYAQFNFSEAIRPISLSSDFGTNPAFILTLRLKKGRFLLGT